MEENLKDEVRKTNELLAKLTQMVEEGKAKKQKLPFSARLSNVKAKKGWVTIQYINENLTQEFFKVPIDEMTTLVKECPRLALPEHMLLYKGKPWIIQPAWSVMPFSANKNYEEAVKDNMTTSGYRILLNRIKNDAIKAKKSLPGWIWLAGLVGIGLLIYFASRGGLK
jgi:hypothetical protein